MSTSFVGLVPLEDPTPDGLLMQDLELCVGEALSPEWRLLAPNPFILKGTQSSERKLFFLVGIVENYCSWENIAPFCSLIPSWDN